MNHARAIALVLLAAPAAVAACGKGASSETSTATDASSADATSPLASDANATVDASSTPDTSTDSGTTSVDAPVDVLSAQDSGMMPASDAANAADASPAVDAGTDAAPFALTGVLAAAGAISAASPDGTGSSFCMLISGGAVRCMGNDLQYQLGNLDAVTAGYSAYAIPAGSPFGASQVSVGSDHACAVAAGGATYCWGSGQFGQLAHVPATKSANGTKWEPVPAAVPALAGATFVAAGESVGCAVLAGTVSCWGLNLYGQAGNGTFVEQDAPVATGVSATRVATGFHTCAVTTGGGLSCWGKGLDGQLGTVNGLVSCSGILCNPSPTAVVEADGGLLTGATDVAVGYNFTCAIVGDGVQCFGSNSMGQLGRGTTDDLSHTVPTAVSGLAGTVTHIAAGIGFACALIQGTGAVQCWGDNQANELGPNATDAGTQSATPVTVLTGAIDVAATGTAACAVMSDSSMQCWGSNSRGDLGRGTQSSALFPTPAAVSAQF